MSTSVEVEVVNPSGIHARPASTFFKATRTFRSSIHVQNLTKGGAPVDTRSILTLISSLDASRGDRIRITAEGEDEASAAESLRALVAGGLGEGGLGEGDRQAGS
ncbi:MAG TPA: HPr family phosphocarrier protein [Candidatus Limnocylindrales bacterium]